MSIAWSGVDWELLRGERLGYMCSSNTPHPTTLRDYADLQPANQATEQVINDKQDAGFMRSW